MGNHFKVLALILIWTVLVSEAGLLTQFAGPFNIVINQVADCEHPERYPIKIIGNRMRKVNRTAYLYSAKIINPLVLDDKKLKMFVSAAKFGNGGWKDNYFMVDLGNFCAAAHMYSPQLHESVMRKMNTTCPLPPGNYSMTDQIVIMDFKWPSLPYGKYRTQMFAKEDDKVLACKAVYADITPKMKNS